MLSEEYWCVIGRCSMQNGAEEEYEEILEQCATLTRACEQAREYSPWFGDDWSILVRRSDKLSGKEFLHSSQQSFEH